jgi:hypothetical protein
MAGKRFPYHSVPVTVEGVTYPSIKSAARALGLTVSGVRNALDRNTTDNLGTGQSRPRPFTYDGVTYRSQSAAARALGISPNTFNSRVFHGRDPVTGA